MQELDWSSLEEFARSVGDSFKAFGSDELTRLLRLSGVRAEKFAEFRQKVRNENGGKPIPIASPFTRAELDFANKRLLRSGIDFLKLEPAESPVALYKEIPQRDWPGVIRWNGIRKILGPSVAFLSALSIGIYMIHTGGISVSGNPALGYDPGVFKLISPYLAGGLGGAGVQWVSTRFLYPYSKSTGLGGSDDSKKLTYLPFQTWGKFLIRDFLYALTYAGLAGLVAHLQPALDFPTAKLAIFSVKAAEAAVLSFASLGMTEVAFEKLKERGLLSQMRALKAEVVSGPLILAATTLFMSTHSWRLGVSLVSAYLFSVTLPIWYKLLIGDRIYDWYTKRVLEGTERKMFFPLRVCARALSDLSRVHTFRR
jgi:hypothetical protein